MSISRVEVLWNLGVGGTGLTVMYGQDGHLLAGDLHTFFEAIKTRIPAGVVLSCSDTGDVIDEATGELQGPWGSGGAWTVTGTGSGTWAAGVGASIDWRTSGIHGGRRVRGRTYLVPLNGFCYSSNGTLDTPALTDLQTATTALVAAHTGNLVIWSRPRKADPTKTPPVTALAGGFSPVIVGTVPDTISTLRSRRT